jgi:predicted Rossmann fold nucleotide-binding protein DprA/Smf involved in DNA uptake
MEYDFKGNISLLETRPRIGIIGSRNVTSNELILAVNKGMTESEKGKIIVTGMANGIDTWAMVGALTTLSMQFSKNLKHIAVVPLFIVMVFLNITVY